MTKKRKLLSSQTQAPISNELTTDCSNRINTISETLSETDLNESEHGNSTRSSTNNIQSSVSLAFPCTSCHKTFATEVDLKAHLIRHLTQHPFVCFSCGKGFKYEHSLNFHVKSYHSGGSNNSSSKGSNEKNNLSTKSKETKFLENNEHEQAVSPLKLKRKSSSTSNNSSEDKKCKQSNVTDNLSDAIKSSMFMAPTLITDENHNQTTARSFNWSNPDFTYFYGKPPTNLPADSPIQIRSEKILISILDAINVATEKSMIFYKCCLCCVAFPTLDQMNLHVQNVHHLNVAEFGSGQLSPNSNAEHQQQQKSQPTNAAAAAAAAMAALLSTAKSNMMEDSKLSSPICSSNTGPMAGSGQPTCYQCDKCLTKFNEPFEYEFHSQLHRTLEMASGFPASSPAAAVHQANSAANQYQFQLLSTLMGQDTAVKGPDQSQNSASSPTVVDFRKILANASKNTDFGRKFAAHLMDGSHHHQTTSPSTGVSSKDKEKQITGNSGDNNFPPSAHDHHRCSPPSLQLIPPSIIPTGTSSVSPLGAKFANNSDNNNNSLLYLSGIVPSEMVGGTHQQQTQSVKCKNAVSKASMDVLNLSANTTDNTTKCSSPSSKSNSGNKLLLNGSKNSANSASSSSSSSSAGSISSRHIKEPVDIFEGF